MKYRPVISCDTQVESGGMLSRRVTEGAIALLTASSVAFGAVDGMRPVPTFGGQVAGIIAKRCVSCHRSSEIAGALPLSSYPDAKLRASAIRTQVITGAMPPWSADPNHSLKFRNDPRLTQDEIDTVVAWVDAGAPEGPRVDSPTATADTGWHGPDGRAPDAVVSLPEISIVANGEIPYVRMRVRVPFKDDRWIRAMEVRPGNRAIVHHMAIAEVALPPGVKPEDLDALNAAARQMGLPSGALDQARPIVRDPENSSAYDMLGVYVPGTTFEAYGEGNAKLLKGGGNFYVNVNVHYTTTGSPEKDLSRVGLWFQGDPPKNILYRVPAPGKTILADGRQLLTDEPGTKAEGTDVVIPPVPAFADNYEIVGVTAYARPISIYQFQPHAHMRGKDFQYDVVYPDGRRQTVLSVPRYDFHWQLAYDLEEPLELPAGSKLIVTAHFDNSANNEHLRNLGDSVAAKKCGPDQEAYFRNQNQSWDEMFSPIIQYSVGADAPPHAAAPTTTVAGAGDARVGTGAPAPSDEQPALVEAVGCLTSGHAGAWVVAQVSTPRSTATQSASGADRVAAAKVMLGNQQLALIGAWPFRPERYAHQKVAVKGLLIQDAGGRRLNMTSLQAVNGTCH